MQIGVSSHVLITHPDDLEELVEILSQQDIIGVDTESNSLHAYREQVCLIQFSTESDDYLVDPLALQDVSALAPIFENDDIEVVFHAGEYDIMCMKRDFGFEFANLFDTMIAARVLGIKNVGLNALIQSEFGISLDKRYQRANWGKRPLPPEMLDYARMDTHFLIELRDRLYDELKNNQRLVLAEEDFKRLCHVNGHFIQAEMDLCLHMNGVYDLEAQQVAVLAEVCKYRDKVAYSLDRPLFKVLSNNTLMAIANQCPTSLDDLRDIPGMSKGNIRRHGRELIRAVKRGQQANPIHIERPQRPDSAYLARIDSLKEWRKGKARQWKVESDVILPKDLLQKIARANPKSLDELDLVMACSHWRFEHYGDFILSVLN